ncbi:ABC transporter permease [Neisseria meningitidis]|nr:ABC transporter permease [Neisseria meningitidis]
MGVGWASAHQSHLLRQSHRSHHSHRIKGFWQTVGIRRFRFSARNGGFGGSGGGGGIGGLKPTLHPTLHPALRIRPTPKK